MRLSWLALIVLAFPRPAAAQRDYRDTHAGRPLRVEDATVEESGAVEFGLPDARLDRLDRGVVRWRFEPSVALGLPHRTAVEVAPSFVWLEPGSAPRGGLTGLDVAVSHAFTAGGGWLPALASTVDAFLPTGAASSGGVWLQWRGMASRVVGAWRFHANVSTGSYRVDVANPAYVCETSKILVKLGYTCDGASTPLPGGPCANVVPEVSPGVVQVFAHCARVDAAFVSDTTIISGPPVLQREGTRWFAGLGMDRDLPSRSMLVQAEIYTSRLTGLQPRPDWGAGLGIRHGAGRGVVFMLGIDRRFAGGSRGWAGTGGLTWLIPLHAAR